MLSLRVSISTKFYTEMEHESKQLQFLKMMLVADAVDFGHFGLLCVASYPCP